jgi:rubrerythrin
MNFGAVGPSMTIRELVESSKKDLPEIDAALANRDSSAWNAAGDLDWELEIRSDDPCIDPTWAPFGRTAAFAALPRQVQNILARRALARALANLQAGEAIGIDVCRRLGQRSKKDGLKNFFLGQAQDEAQHFAALTGFVEKMGGARSDIDPFLEARFNEILASDDEAFLIASTQFFTENLAVPMLQRMESMATHPLLKQIFALMLRDESKHASFGVRYVADRLRDADPETRLAFGSFWLARILQELADPYGSYVAMLVRNWLSEAGVEAFAAIADRLIEEQRAIREKEREMLARGEYVPQLLLSAVKVGLLAPDILNALGAEHHPLIAGALKAAGRDRGLSGFA